MICQPRCPQLVASTVGFTKQLYCAFDGARPKHLSQMSYRNLLLLVIILPVLLVGAAGLMDVRIPVPQLGRDYVLRIAIEAAPAPLALPPIAGPDDASRPLVVIDAGHGGRDPGAIGEAEDGARFQEKNITLALAKALRDELLRIGTIRVALTRDDDRILPLADRPEIARRLAADLFISIHADSAGERDTVSGASVYTLSNEASSEAAARFAMRENSADRVNGINVAGQSEAVSALLVELSQQRTQDDAARFANLLLRESEGVVAFVAQPKRSAALAVLRAPDVPSVLFESGFVTNQADRARLTTAEGRKAYAEVLARAIRVYFARAANDE
jgi:N-acetylmuramoyl-L-alanine amidase